MKFRKKKIKSFKRCTCQHSCKQFNFPLAVATTSSPDIVLAPGCRETCLRWGHPEFSSSSDVSAEALETRIVCRSFSGPLSLVLTWWREQMDTTGQTAQFWCILLDCRTDPVWISTLVLIYGGPGFIRTQFCGEDEFEILTSPGPADIFWSAGQTSGPDFF